MATDNFDLIYQRLKSAKRSRVEVAIDEVTYYPRQVLESALKDFENLKAKVASLHALDSELDSKNLDSQNVHSQKLDSQNPNSQNPNSQNSDSQISESIAQFQNLNTAPCLEVGGAGSDINCISIVPKFIAGQNYIFKDCYYDGFDTSHFLTHQILKKLPSTILFLQEISVMGVDFYCLAVPVLFSYGESKNFEFEPTCALLCGAFAQNHKISNVYHSAHDKYLQTLTALLQNRQK